MTFPRGTALGLLAALLVGCGLPLRYPQSDAPEADAVLRDVPSSLFLLEVGGGGSFTAIAPPLFATAAHTMHGDDGRSRVRAFGADGAADGVVRAGTDAPLADWVIVRYPALGDAVGWIAPDHPLREGEPIWFVGYTGPEGPTLGPARADFTLRRPQRCFRGRVVARPRAPVEERYGAIYARLDDPDGVPRGISGGPAAVWDAALDRYVIVGINSFVWDPVLGLPTLVAIPFTTDPARRGAILLDREWVEENHAMAGRRSGAD